MGSCFSRRPAPPTPTLRLRSPPRHPEPEPPQEEKVKEVLSETPARARIDLKPKPKPRQEDPVDDRSDLSYDLCSLTETLSTTTEKRGEPRPKEADRSPPRYRPKKRSFSGELPRRERAVDIGCGGVRSSPSPVRRREGAVGRTNSAREVRVRPPPPPLRRDLGERSGRRAAAQAVKRAVELGGQCRSVSAPRTIGNGNGNGNGNAKASPRRTPVNGSGGKRAVVDEGRLGEGTESLENPLVSMECFIFL